MKIIVVLLFSELVTLYLEYYFHFWATHTKKEVNKSQ